jgi:hypothetical protein
VLKQQQTPNANSGADIGDYFLPFTFSDNLWETGK